MATTWHFVVGLLLFQQPSLLALRIGKSRGKIVVCWTSDGLPKKNAKSSSSSSSSSSSFLSATPAPDHWIPERLDENRRDVFQALAHLGGCVAGAVGVSAYQDFDCSTLKPQAATLRSRRWGAATAGMGRGTETDSDDPPAYNAVMLQHRKNTVPRWKADSAQASVETVRSAVQAIYAALHAVESLGKMAQDYDWDAMKSLLRSPRLTRELDQACSVLRGASSFLSPQDRAEIGFHWGSCAWRHCGALADAQESLAELYNLVGMLEPFECLFCLDIVERSLRDILAVVPLRYHPSQPNLKPYQPYQSQALMLEMDDSSSPMDYGAIDREFLRVLGELRSP